MLTLSRVLVLVAACMWVAWFDFGLQTPSGAFFPIMKDFYQSDRSTTASVFGLFTVMNRGLGLPTGLLIQKFGITKISFIGSALVPLGLLSCVFATSIYHVLVCFGFISAIGVILTFICSATILRRVCSGPYKKWLRVCLALHSSCLSLAGFTYPFLIAYLNDLFTLPGVFLIFGGFLLNNICVSLLFYYTSKDKKDGNDAKKDAERGTTDSVSDRVFTVEIADDNRQASVPTKTFEVNNIVTDNNDITGSPDMEGETGTKTVDTNTADPIPRTVRNVPDNIGNGTKSRTESDVTMKRCQDILCGHFNLAFASLFIATSLALGTAYSFLAVFIDMLQSKGYSNELALNAYIPLQILALACRLLPGFASKVDTTWLLATFSACGAIGQVVIMFASNYYFTLFGVGLCGMTLGGVLSAGTVEVASVVSKERFPVALGQILTGTGLVATSLSPTYGALVDTWQNYDIVMTLTAGLQSLAAVLFICSGFLKRRSRQRISEESRM